MDLGTFRNARSLGAKDEIQYDEAPTEIKPFFQGQMNHLYNVISSGENPLQHIFFSEKSFDTPACLGIWRKSCWHEII